MALDQLEKLQMEARVSQAFSPSAPINKSRLFAGRIDQVSEVINAVMQRGQHVIIYGERGVGKTSLANVLSDFLTKVGFRGLDSVIVNCDGTTTFSSLWQKICREMFIVNRTVKPGFSDETNDTQMSLDSALPQEVTPDDVRYLFQRVSAPTIIVDEMDRIRSRDTTTLLADTVKTLSDHSIDTTLILVGVADSVDGLIAEHRSIERALVQIRMPRMSKDELFEIIDKGLEEVGMAIEDGARQQIADLSQGLPHFTHLLGLHSAQHAIRDERKHVAVEDVRAAIGLAVAKAQQSIVSAYHSATASPRKNLYPQVLLASALAEKDELGYFSAADVRGPMSDIMGVAYDIPAFARHLNDFCEDKRGPILQKMGHERRFRYRFINPLMEPFVTMKGLASGLITEDVLNGSL
jgi:Cdc6-like AAA superfamily ATPase